MTVSTIGARHRSARRPATALTDLANAATGSMATVGRRTAVVAASSGLIVSMLGSPAAAAPSSDNAASLPSVDTEALTGAARAALQTSPVVSVPTGTAWSFDAPEVASVAPPKVVVAAKASRSATRTAVAASAPIPQSVSGNAVLEIAARYVGVPYRYGGTTPAGFDCSGFTSYVFAQLGVSLGRTTGSQRNAGTVVARADALPGDLIWTSGHVAIYAGGDMQIDAPRTGKTVQFRSIWQSNPIFIRIG